MPVNVFTTIDDSVASTGTTPAFDINNLGRIAGQFSDAGGTPGFLLNGSTFTTADDPVATGFNTRALPSTIPARSSGLSPGAIPMAPCSAGAFSPPSMIPSPPLGTEASGIERPRARSSGTSTISVGQVGTDFQVAGLGSFSAGNTPDMLLRNATTGAFEVYEISDNNVTNATALGTIGLDFQLVGFGDFNHDGGTDMVLRNKNTGQFRALQHQQQCRHVGMKPRHGRAQFPGGALRRLQRRRHQRHEAAQYQQPPVRALRHR
jgi:hypothetical protein